jgi:hypothetical protein
MTELKPVKSKNGEKIEIDLSGFAKGMYIMNIFSNEGVIVKKIIRE